jgi:hypothetical protein
MTDVSRKTGQPARRKAALAREAGLEFAGRANRWMIAGAVTLAAGLSALTAHAFHAHAATRPSTSQQSAQTQPSGDDGTSGLQAPSQAPSTTSPAPAPAPVVSGGS